jgi:hypothetical protein
MSHIIIRVTQERLLELLINIVYIEGSDSSECEKHMFSYINVIKEDICCLHDTKHLAIY